MSREVCTMATPQPSIGEWYRLNRGDSFEIVAVDEDDGTVEIQHFDGTIEEMDLEDWDAHCVGRRAGGRRSSGGLERVG